MPSGYSCCRRAPRGEELSGGELLLAEGEGVGQELGLRWAWSASEFEITADDQEAARDLVRQFLVASVEALRQRYA